jgi:crotonobetainyl-CoA:carnitine CoA-transferase CaiB-like acyl-CoA transferase
MSTAPLGKFRILEISHMLAGPYCGMLLADLGAEVIKVETGEGDIARTVGNHRLGDHNVYFASLNRNKKSVLLDLGVEADRGVFHGLVRSSHGLITNLRPRAIRKLGLTYETLKTYNPNIACLALTGFGLEGPYSELPAYDYIIQAMTGIAMLTGEPEGPPIRAGYSVVDNTGGMMAAIALLSKLAEGSGGQLDVALYDVILSQLNYLAAAYLNAGEVPVRHPSGGHAFFVPAQIFATLNGYLALFITHDRFWHIFVEKISRPEWVHDERFATVMARSRHRQIVVDAIGAELGTKSTEEWIALLQPAGLVVAGVGTLAEALASQHTHARRMIANIEIPGEALHLIANPIKISGYGEQYLPPPLLGEHTELYCAAVTDKTPR